MAVHSDARAGAKDWKDCDRRGPRGARHGDDWTDRVDGEDLCLDVALRLGKIIEQRLPGADVVYTRSDDTFVPLEERTNIANQAKADLFISIHANSSRDHAARGIETYYLNLKGSAEAMEVAARENATAQEAYTSCRIW